MAGLITGAIAALVSAPITAYIQQGASGGGTVALREVLASTSDNLLQAVTLQGFVSDPLDKALSFLAVFVLLRVLPRSILDRFTEARSFSRSKRVSARYGAAVVLSLLALICVWVFRPAFGTSIYAIFFLAVVLSAWYGGLGPGILAGCVGRPGQPGVSVATARAGAGRRRLAPHHHLCRGRLFGGADHRSPRPHQLGAGPGAGRAARSTRRRRAPWSTASSRRCCSCRPPSSAC